MESDAIDVGNVTDKYPEAVRLIGGPETGRFVVAATGKVVAGGGEADLPHGKHVAFVSY